MEIIRGIPKKPIRCVIYGPEGIGKSTFASLWPDPVFIDTEDSTAFMDVARYPKPTSWQMLLDELRDAGGRFGEFKTIVLDTADWAEALCKSHVCRNRKVSGIEDFGYGKGYTYLAEEWGKLLDTLTGLRDKGFHIVMTAHAAMRKFEQPNEMGAYDRWELKLEKKTAPMVKEWADLVLFANYETFVIKDGEGKNAKNKAQGGRRVLFTTHHACWDAKNRQGLPEKVEFTREECAGMIEHLTSGAQAGTQKAHERPQKALEASEGNYTPSVENAPQSAPEAVKEENTGGGSGSGAPPGDSARFDLTDLYEGIPRGLADLMQKDGIDPETLAKAQAMKWGYFPQDMAVKDWPPEFCEYITTVWEPLKNYMEENEINGLPF